MFGVRFSSSTSSSNCPLEITALTVVSPTSLAAAQSCSSSIQNGDAANGLIPNELPRINGVQALATRAPAFAACNSPDAGFSGTDTAAGLSAVCSLTAFMVFSTSSWVMAP